VLSLKQLKGKNDAFTIIETLIVLAIAGVIMIIVFIAVPQLQRAQRDNARQDAVRRLKAEMETYAGNNQGVYPVAVGACTGNATNDKGKLCDFKDRYITGKVAMDDPKYGPYDIKVLTVGNDPGDGVMGIYATAACAGERAGTASGSRQLAVVVKLDRTNTFYCVDNG
jgi:prepilin-type N-terminal cleavage/methylation domain-containing protein